MGNVYFRNVDGELEPMRNVHVVVDTAPAEDGLDISIHEFNQMNDLVSAYLSVADAAYTDVNGDSVSVVENYGTAEGDADRPLGYPLASGDGTLYVQYEDSGKGWKLPVDTAEILSSIYNALPGMVAQYLVKDKDGKLLENGRILPKGAVRMIRFYGDIRNCRDLGGWTCDGGVVNYGMLIRSGVVASSETWIDPKIAANIGIRHHIDFRNDEEAGYITESCLGADVQYHRYPLELYYDNCIKTSSADRGNLTKVMRTIFDAVSRGEAVIYNCSLGRDRTGTVTFLLLALLGVAKADIDKDYELTSFSALDTPASRTREDYQGLERYLSTFGGETLRDNAVWWFIKMGFTLAELNAFRAAMSTGTPEELSTDNFIATYYIKNHLNNCDTDNHASSVNEGSGYTATITPVSNYKIDSVIVTVGGVDVTAQVYSDGVVTIPAVTGDVVITAVAVYVPPYTNQIPLATDTDGSIFNGCGYQKGYRINSSGGLTEADSCYVTGFIPCKTGDVIYFNKGIKSTSANMLELRLGFYDADKNNLDDPTWQVIVDADTTTFHENDDVASFVVPALGNGEVAYMRYTAFFIDDSYVVTVNEEIVD